MKINDTSFIETSYTGWTTYGDVLKLPELVAGIEEAINFLGEGDNLFNGKTYGDKLRFVFEREHGIAELLKSLRKNATFETKKLIALVLIINDIQDFVINSPVSIESITEYRVIGIIDEHRVGPTTTRYREEDEEEENELSIIERMKILEEKGFPLISTEGDIVMFLCDNEKNTDTIFVTILQSGRVMKMDKDGCLISEQETKEGRNNGETSLEKAAKMGISLVRE